MITRLALALALIFAPLSAYADAFPDQSGGRSPGAVQECLNGSGVAVPLSPNGCANNAPVADSVTNSNTAATTTAVQASQATPGSDASKAQAVQGITGGKPVSVTATTTALTPTNDSGTVTAGGTSQVAIASNSSRKGCLIENPASATTQGIPVSESLFVNFNSSASTTGSSVEILPGGSIGCAFGGVVTSGVNVTAPTMGHKFTVLEFN